MHREPPGMDKWVGIEELKLSPARPAGPLPSVSMRLLETIREHGPIEPVVVRRLAAYKFEILSNPETWLAVQRLGHREVPITVREDVSDAEAADIVAVAYRDTRQNPIDEARLLRDRFEELGGHDTRGAMRRLASIAGLSTSYVSHAIRLLELPMEVQEMIGDQKLQAGHAKLLVSIKDRQTAVRLARQIMAEGLSVRQTEELARAARGGASTGSPEPPAVDPDIVRLERAVTELVGCQVSIDVALGKFVVDYARDLEVLDGVLARLGYRHT